MKIPKLKICELNKKLYIFGENNNKLNMGYYFDIIDIKYKNNNIYLIVEYLNNNFYNDISLLKTIINLKLNTNIKIYKKKKKFFLLIENNNIDIIINGKKNNLINFFNIFLEKKYLFNIYFYPIIIKKKKNYELKFIINTIIISSNIFISDNKTFVELIENSEINNSPI